MAKRNFRIRHNHCDFVPPPIDVDYVISSGKPKKALLSSELTCLEIGNHDDANKNPTPFAFKGERTGSDQDSSSSNQDCNPKSGDYKNSSPLPANPKSSESECTESSSSLSQELDVRSSNQEVSDARRSAWTSLLSGRSEQNDGRNTSSWLMSILELGHGNASFVQRPGDSRTCGSDGSKQTAEGSSKERNPPLSKKRKAAATGNTDDRVQLPSKRRMGT